jgi:DNA-binding NtrC family response regulator
MRLYNCDWLGNVRELKNVVERLVILSEAGEVNESNYELVNQFGMHNNDSNAEISITKLMPLKDAISKTEEIIIRKAYKEQGSIVKTAKLLKVDPSTLHRKIKKNHIKINP